MSRGLKSALTLMALLVVVVAAGWWGWGAVTVPLPERPGPKDCTEVELAAGESLTPERVIVSVYNASDRTGLAGRTAEEFASQGFAIGETADAPGGTDVRVAEVWVDNPQGPVGLLVRSYFGRRARVVQREPLGPGVTVVVGERFRAVGEGKKSIELTEDLTVCVPPTAP